MRGEKFNFANCTYNSVQDKPLEKLFVKRQTTQVNSDTPQKRHKLSSDNITKATFPVTTAQIEQSNILVNNYMHLRHDPDSITRSLTGPQTQQPSIYSVESIATPHHEIQALSPSSFQYEPTRSNNQPYTKTSDVSGVQCMYTSGRTGVAPNIPPSTPLIPHMQQSGLIQEDVNHTNMHVFDKKFRDSIQPMLDSIEKIREHLSDINIDVPGVLVAGAQSSGKSSLLENLSGIELPRGDTITTRVPLLLRLEFRRNSVPHAIIGKKANLTESGDQIEISQVASKIQEYTAELTAGESQAGVVDAPIHLKVVRPYGPTMTVIDLPGIAFNSADESVAEVIHDDTTKLIEKYAENKQMILLCVLTATEDFANCEAIKIAKKYDPQMKRTLGVVTKIDMIGNCSQIKDKIRGQYIKLDLGFIAVRNRTQEEVQKGDTYETVRNKEKQFFHTNPEVKGLESCFWGIGTLVNKIVGIQTENIKDFFPHVKQQIRDKLDCTKSMLDNLPVVLDTNAARQIMMQQYLIQFSSRLQELKDGNIVDFKHKYRLSARLFEIFESFEQQMRMEIPDFLGSEEYGQKLKETLEESRGFDLVNFLSSFVMRNEVRKCFHAPLKKNVTYLIEKSTQLIQEVINEILEKECMDKRDRFKQLIKSVISDFILQQKELCCYFCNDLIRCEIYNEPLTRDEYYAHTIQSIQSYLKSDIDEESLDKLMANVEPELWNFIENNRNVDPSTLNLTLMQTSLYTYAKIVLKRDVDICCKAIQHFLISPLKEKVSLYVISQITPEVLEKTLQEDPHSSNHRQMLNRDIYHMNIALEEIKLYT